MISSVSEMISCYEKHKNLKIAASELGMSFQTLYYHLRKAGVAVIGDKERYGSAKDRFAFRCEALFKSIISDAEDQNDKKFQSKIDFIVNGINVDVKGASIQKPGKSPGGHRWLYSIKKQIVEADFFVMFGFENKESDKQSAIFLIPAELIAAKQTISISCYGKSKWHAYEVSEADLLRIFKEMK